MTTSWVLVTVLVNLVFTLVHSKNGANKNELPELKYTYTSTNDIKRLEKTLVSTTKMLKNFIENQLKTLNSAKK